MNLHRGRQRITASTLQSANDFSKENSNGVLVRFLGLWFAAVSIASVSIAAEEPKPLGDQPSYRSIQSIDIGSIHASNDVSVTAVTDQEWELHGATPHGSTTVVVKPSTESWDFSQYAFLRIDLTNNGKGLVQIKGRLDNHGAQDWANSSTTIAFVMPGERATIGFPYPRPWDQNDAPSVFDQMSGKPNGHRTHWKSFNPKKVVACRLQIESTDGSIDLQKIRFGLAYRYGMEFNRHRAELPLLDRFGQMRTIDWPGKLHDESELKLRHRREASVAANDQGPSSFNQYGGWRDGPDLKATGYFRIDQHDGKWWIIDPSGKLFFSHGLNTVGFRGDTPITGRENLFAWLPEPEDPLFETMIASTQDKQRGSFLRGNLNRTFGPDWKDEAIPRVQNRLRRWGINTIGAWSDDELIMPHGSIDARTPYTEMLHLWRGEWTRLTEDTPDPFSKDFPSRIRIGLENFIDLRGQDPYRIGVFIDNETDWPNNLVEIVFKANPKQPAKLAFISWLKTRFESIERLNEAWASDFASWDALAQSQEIRNTPARQPDFDKLYSMLADRYYSACQQVMRRVMPNHLYLGSRIHTCPPVVAQAAAKYVDVFSVNSYAPHATTATLPKGVDKPVLITEYHFAAPDRGVPGVGLSPVGDQLQRSRAFGAFVTSGLQHRQIVGAHWFTYADQSAAGRPYENYQIGFVDVTDTPYRLITEASRRIADSMYEIRSAQSPRLLKVLESLWRQ